MEPGQVKHLAEYNDGFMMDMRSFLKGDEDQLNRLVYHIRHNPGQVGVVNYMANTNGFTLMDMVSYDTKHNEANGRRTGTEQTTTSPGTAEWKAPAERNESCRCAGSRYAMPCSCCF